MRSWIVKFKVFMNESSKLEEWSILDEKRKNFSGQKVHSCSVPSSSNFLYGAASYDASLLGLRLYTGSTKPYGRLPAAPQPDFQPLDRTW